jgi:hypothetical protein
MDNEYRSRNKSRTDGSNCIDTNYSAHRMIRIIKWLFNTELGNHCLMALFVFVLLILTLIAYLGQLEYY